MSMLRDVRGSHWCCKVRVLHRTLPPRARNDATELDLDDESDAPAPTSARSHPREIVVDVVDGQVAYLLCVHTFLSCCSTWVTLAAIYISIHSFCRAQGNTAVVHVRGDAVPEFDALLRPGQVTLRGLLRDSHLLHNTFWKL